jgi:Homeodomain-like domain
MQKRAVHLQPPERDRLIALVSKGHHQANFIKRAYMLLHSDAGFTDDTIAQLLFSSADSVRRVRLRYLNEGLDAALEDKPHSGREPALPARRVFDRLGLQRTTSRTRTLDLGTASPTHARR